MEHAKLIELVGGLAACVPRRLLTYYLRNLGALAARGWYVHGAVLALRLEGATRTVEDETQEVESPERAVAAGQALDHALGELLETGPLRFGAEILDLGGGGALCLFVGEDHAARALAAATASRDATLGESGITTEGLSCSAGIAGGRFYTGLVGDLERRAAYMVGGATIDAALQAADVAAAGEVLVGPGTAEKLAGRYEVLERRGDLCSAGKLHRFVERVKLVPPAVDLERAEDLEAAVRALAAYVPGNDPWQPVATPPAPEYGPAAVLAVRFSGVDFEAGEQVTADLDTYYRTLVDVARSRGGMLQRLAPRPGGGRALILFARNDVVADTRAALLAGLDLLRAAPSLPMDLTLRLGAARGEVFRGAIGPQLRRGFAAHGAAVSRAIGLCQAAGSDQLLADGGLPLEQIPGLGIKGPAASVTAGRAKIIDAAVLPGESLTLRRSGSPKLLVGRQAELTRLQSVSEQARDGQVRVLLLVGAAGTGKSRLVERLAADWRGAGGRCVQAECLPEGSETPYGVWREALRSVFAIQPGESHRDVVHKLTAGLDRLPRPLGRWARLMAEATGWGVGDEELAALDPKLKKNIFFDVVHAVLRDLAARGPLLLVLDNLHWADEVSRELFEFLGASMPEAAVMFCGTYRPPFRATVPRPERVVQVDLPAQQEQEGMALLGAALQGQELPAAVLRGIWEKTHGNPGAALELIRLLRERDELPGRGDEEGERRFREFLYRSVPDGLEGLVRERLALLPPAHRQVLQQAAVVGRHFSFDLLRVARAGAAADDESVLVELLDQLEVAGWIHKILPAKHLTFGFTRPISQEGVLRDVLLVDARRIHTAVAEDLEGRARRQAESGAEQLALHFAESDRPHRAFRYALVAGRRAVSLGGERAALAHLDRAAALLERVDLEREIPEDERRLNRIEIAELRGDVQLRLGQPEAARAEFERMRRQAERANEDRATARAEAWLAATAAHSAPPAEVLMAVRGARERAENAGEDRALRRALQVQAEVLMREGRMEEALAATRDEISVAGRLNRAELLARARNRAGRISAIRGDLGRAVSALVDALASYRNARDRFGESEVLNALGLCHRRQGDIGRALLALGQALRLGEELGVRPSAAITLGHLGDLYRLCNLHQRALDNHRRALELLERIGELKQQSRLRCAIGEDLLAAGDLSRAVREFRTALELADRQGIRMARLDALLGLTCLEFQAEGARSPLTHLSEVLQLAEATAAPDFLARARHLAGQVGLLRGRQSGKRQDLERARDDLVQAHEDCLGAVDETLTWPIALHLGAVFDALDDPVTAQTWYSQARKTLGQIASTIGDPEMRRSFLAGPVAQAVVNSGGGVLEE